MAIDTLIKTLADGSFHSGEELGQLLGVSRTAVWKQLKKLESLGLSVESVKGKGYRLSTSLELLDKTRIQAQLDEAPGGALVRLEVCGTIESTNSALLNIYDEGGEAHAMACLAEQQTRGRGRRGRNWVSPFGHNLYLSLGWSFNEGAAALEGLSLAVGLAVARALKPYAIQGVGLKWPNDILVNGKKLGGILLEIRGDAAGPCFVVIGIGLNVAMQQELAAGIDQPWTDLQSVCDESISRNQLAATVVSELTEVLVDFAKTGFGALREEWQQYDIFEGAAVDIITVSGSRKAVAHGVTPTGALQVEIDGQLETLHGGEVSLRAVQ